MFSRHYWLQMYRKSPAFLHYPSSVQSTRVEYRCFLPKDAAYPVPRYPGPVYPFFPRMEEKRKGFWEEENSAKTIYKIYFYLFFSD